MWEQRAATIVQPVTRRFNRRPVSSAAYRLGERLATKGAIVRAHLPTGGAITLDMRDHGHRAVFFGGVLEPETTAAFSELLTKDSVFLDVGANAGYYSVLAVDLGARMVHAFEPNPDVLATLRHTAASTPRIKLNEIGCGLAPGDADLFMPDQSGNTGLATVSPRDAKSSRTVQIRLTSVDAYCSEHRVEPTVMKIDVEGFELEVLQGSEQTLRECRPAVIIEINYDTTREFMRHIGYTERTLSEHHAANSLFLPLGSQFMESHRR